MKLSELSLYLEQQGFPNTIDGNADLEIMGVNTLHEAQQGEISFLANIKYREQLFETKASAVIVNHEDVKPDSLSVIRCSNPYGALAATVIAIHGVRKHPQWGCRRQNTNC